MDITLHTLATDISQCDHGSPFCPYKNVDDEVCICCLKDQIEYLRKEIKKISGRRLVDG